jgi:hypothetical protein
MPIPRHLAIANHSALCLAACGGGDNPGNPSANGGSTGTTAGAGTTGSGTGTSGAGSGSAGSTSSAGTGAGAASGASSGIAAGSTGTGSGTTSTGTVASTTATGTTSSVPATVYGDLRKASLGIGASLNGTVPFPANNAWNTDISQRPVDPNSDAIIASIGAGTGLHPDFGVGIGIPYMVVSGTQARVPIHWTAYGDESDDGPYPIPANAPVEGAPAEGDRHVLVIDRDNNRLYELGNGYYNVDGSWNANCGAIFFLDSNNVRPGGQPGWTSADAAGLPIFPGLARYDEAVLGPGGIKHALRFTVVKSRRAYVPPATHWASSNTATNLPPMGARLRLKASYVIPANYSKEVRAVLQALKTYGMIMADNGSNWFITGAPDNRWNDDELHVLSQVKGSNFEVIRMDGLVTP